MSVICPTIIAHTPDEFARQSQNITPFAERVQIDITDGDFASPATINLNQVYYPDNWTVDLHLMLREPAKWIEAVVSLDPNLVIIHAEADGDLAGVMGHLRKFGIKVGVALLPETPVDSVKELILAADHVLVFAGSLGQQGGVADLSQLNKVPQIKNINPDIEIGWDGGANLDNIQQIATGGVDLINVGSAIQAANDPTKAYQKLTNLTE